MGIALECLVLLQLTAIYVPKRSLRETLSGWISLLSLAARNRLTQSLSHATAAEQLLPPAMKQNLSSVVMILRILVMVTLSFPTTLAQMNPVFTYLQALLVLSGLNSGGPLTKK